MNAAPRPTRMQDARCKIQDARCKIQMPVALGKPASCILNLVSLLVILFATVVGVSAEDWTRVTGPPEIVLPRDYGAHPLVRTEWWYLTANLDGDDGRRYGVQVTFFRYGLVPSAPAEGDSPLRARHALAAHFAITDVDGGRLVHAERVRRADGGFAGFATEDLDVWLGDWRIGRRDGDVLVATAADRVAEIDVELHYRPIKGLIRHGLEGYSRKGSNPGNASAYISMTRLEVSGALTLGDRRIAVSQPPPRGRLRADALSAA